MWSNSLHKHTLVIGILFFFLFISFFVLKLIAQIVSVYMFFSFYDDCYFLYFELTPNGKH